MFWSNRKDENNEKTDSIADKVNTVAEGLFRSGKMNCAEAVVQAVKDEFRSDLPDDVVRLAAGFGGGSGSGCQCGAVAGGTMALGLILQADRKKVMTLTKDLHKWFHDTYGSTCCRVIRGHDKGVCPELTGAVAGKIAELLQ
jgi:C_GCAxxG_C_C family probable redox protein